MGKKAVFLDRDGTINIEKEYLYRVDDWEWIERSVNGIQALNRAGYLVIVITNQAGVARGKYTEAEIRSLHAFVDQELAGSGAKIDAYYYCPHHPQYGDRLLCDCRKPAPGMIFQAQKDLGIDLTHSYMVGDKISDMQTAMAAGVRPIMVLTGYGESQSRACTDPVACVNDLFAASEYILRESKG